MDTTRKRLIVFVWMGIGLVVLTLKVSLLPIHVRGVTFMSGGWLMAIGCLYQVKLYAEEKDILYYVMVIFAALFWIAMLALTLFYIAVLIGWA